MRSTLQTFQLIAFLSLVPGCGAYRLQVTPDGCTEAAYTDAKTGAVTTVRHCPPPPAPPDETRPVISDK